MLTITLICPPQRRQTSMSIAKTRLRRSAQVIARCRSLADGSLDSTALPTTRVLGTTRARSTRMPGLPAILATTVDAQNSRLVTGILHKIPALWVSTYWIAGLAGP
jgi:hypothetical protein